MAVLFAVTILQALALAAFDARAGSRSFYLPFKMVYLAVLPCAVLGALALATASAAIASRLPLVRVAAAPLIIAPLIIAALLAGGRLPVKRQHSPISESALAAGLWARGAVPPGCIDYFSAHWLTGYWLHLDVLGNPRLSDRMRAETFDFPGLGGQVDPGQGPAVRHRRGSRRDSPRRPRGHDPPPRVRPRRPRQKHPPGPPPGFRSRIRPLPW